MNLKNKNFTLVYFFFILFLFFYSDVSFSQNETSDPKTWKYFQIIGKTEDDTLFVQVQLELDIVPVLPVVNLVVNVTDSLPDYHYIVIGNENDTNSLRFSFYELSPQLRKALLDWDKPNKINLSAKTEIKKSESDVAKKFVFAPVSNTGQLISSYNYINPYFQIAGGERFGFALKGHLGLSFGLGNKYSTFFESNEISAGIHFFGFSISYLSRINGMNSHYIESGNKSTFPNQYNNIFAFKNAVEFKWNFPLGNFLEFGYITPVNNNKYGGNVLYDFYENGDSLKPLPDNILSGKYFNFELRYPFKFLGAGRTQFYTAYYLKEVNIGFFSRESKLHNIKFDTRLNFTITKIRNFQISFEALINSLGKIFDLKNFAIGPALRLTKLESGSFGIHTFFVNMRFKVNDYLE